MKNSRRALVAGISFIALTCPFAAAAQEASQRSGISDEIIVTATRREESILDVPVSIAAFSQESLDRKGIRSIEELSRVTPGLSITQGFAGIKYISIRGIESRWGATTTGVYIDETPVQVRSLSISTNFYPGLFDLERVEVLRGPQGTLFGAGAMGGAVRFILAKPGLTEYTGSARAEVGHTEGGDLSWELGGAVGGPIVQDKIGFRASGYYRRDGGYIDRVPYYDTRGTAEKNSNSNETFVGNASLTFVPTEGLEITPSIFYQKINRNDTSQFWTWTAASTRTPLPYFTNREGYASWGRDRSTLYSLKAEYDLGGASVISNTSFMDRKVRSSEDGTNFLLDIFQLGFDTQLPFAAERSYINVLMTQRNFTQELRLQSNPDTDSKLSYVLGLYYQNLRQTVTEQDGGRGPEFGPYFVAPFFLGLPFGTPLPLLENNAYVEAFDRSRDRQYAAFANLDYKLTDQLTVSAGVRVSRMKFDFLGESNFLGGLDSVTGGAKETPITPKFGIQYTPTEDWLIYASASKGFRPGGSNRQDTTGTCADELEAVGLTQIPADYKSDSVWNYEVGAKGRIGNIGTIAGSIFNVDWSNRQQLRTLLPCGSVFIDNLGDARSRGFDVQVMLQAAEGLTFDIGVGYQDTTFQDTIYAATTADPQPVISRKGDRLATPWVVNAAVDYETPLNASGLSGYGHVQYDFKSAWKSSNPGNQSYNPDLVGFDDQHFVSARLGVRNGPLDVSLFVNNLLDSRDIVGKLNFAPSERLLIQTFRPRTWGLTAGYRF